jgi:lysophospholipase L1-like esterase
MRSTLLFLAAMWFGAPATFAQPAQAASGPTPYPASAKDWPGQGAIRVFGWMTDNRKTFWQDRERKQGSVVFAGDSLVGGWGSMAKDFPDLRVANRGIGGEVTRGLLFRFQEDVLDLHPKAIVLLTGSNDLSAMQDPKQSRANITAMLDLAQSQSPGVPVVLCTIPPRQHAQAPVEPAKVAELNKLITSLADGRPNVTVLDLHALLAEPDGSPHLDYFAQDKLHLSTAGFQRFREALAPLFRQLKVS